MSIALPSAGSGVPISVALRELVINVDAQGAVYVSGQRVEPQELARIVEQRVAANPEQKVSVRGDQAVAYAHIIQVLDICKAAGIAEPFLDTKHEN
jgi:biopolymer transport protein ExbD